MVRFPYIVWEFERTPFAHSTSPSSKILADLDGVGNALTFALLGATHRTGADTARRWTVRLRVCNGPETGTPVGSDTRHALP
jgi:hypothetical protein